MSEVNPAKCGMDCTECRFAEENDCPGCMYSLPPENGGGQKLFEDEECEVGICCTEKGYAHCGMCREFPCDALKAVSFDTETGDGGSRLLTLKELHDSGLIQKRRAYGYPAAGGCAGLAAGTAAGCFAGSPFAWALAGLILGVGLGRIIAVSKSDRKK